MAEYRQFCSLSRALDAIGDRWNLLIVRELLIDSRRTHELKAALPGIATNLLSDRLRQLVELGVVQRTEHPGRKAVTYSLTTFGQGLRAPVLELIRWGAAFMICGPRSDDTTQPQWLVLALEAMLPPSGLPEASVHLQVDGADLGLYISTTGVAIAMGAPSSALASALGTSWEMLGLFSGLVPPGSPRLSNVRIADPTGVVAQIAALAAQHNRHLVLAANRGEMPASS